MNDNAIGALVGIAIGVVALVVLHVVAAGGPRRWLADLCYSLADRIHEHSWRYQDRDGKVLDVAFRSCTRQECARFEERTASGWKPVV